MSYPRRAAALIVGVEHLFILTERGGIVLLTIARITSHAALPASHVQVLKLVTWTLVTIPIPIPNSQVHFRWLFYEFRRDHSQTGELSRALPTADWEEGIDKRVAITATGETNNYANHRLPLTGWNYKTPPCRLPTYLVAGTVIAQFLYGVGNLLFLLAWLSRLISGTIAVLNLSKGLCTTRAADPHIGCENEDISSQSRSHLRRGYNYCAQKIIRASYFESTFSRMLASQELLAQEWPRAREQNIDTWRPEVNDMFTPNRVCRSTCQLFFFCAQACTNVTFLRSLQLESAVNSCCDIVVLKRGIAMRGSIGTQSTSHCFLYMCRTLTN